MIKKNIGIITARGGSKRIKNKNIINFFGKPLISYVISAAKKSNLFDKLYVCTDSDKIRKISITYGAEVPFLREKNFADDYTGTHAVVCNFIKKIDLKNVDHICCLYPTAPLMRPLDLTNGLKVLKKNIKKYIFSATQISINNHYYFNLNKKKNIKKVYHTNIKEINYKKNFYVDAGQFYWASKKTWLIRKEIIVKDTAIIEVPFDYAQDLNDKFDLKLLKLKAKIK